MPTYDYECAKCGDTFEYFQKMTDLPLEKCPKCGGEVKRLISAGSGIIFKGKGFYQTDYKSSIPGKSKTGDRPELPCGKTDKPKFCDGKSCPNSR